MKVRWQETLLFVSLWQQVWRTRTTWQHVWKRLSPRENCLDKRKMCKHHTASGFDLMYQLWSYKSTKSCESWKHMSMKTDSNYISAGTLLVTCCTSHFLHCVNWDRCCAVTAPVISFHPPDFFAVWCAISKMPLIQRPSLYSLTVFRSRLLQR